MSFLKALIVGTLATRALRSLRADGGAAWTPPVPRYQVTPGAAGAGGGTAACCQPPRVRQSS
jgi:hypothetical protein